MFSADDFVLLRREARDKYLETAVADMNRSLYDKKRTRSQSVLVELREASRAFSVGYFSIPKDEVYRFIKTLYVQLGEVPFAGAYLNVFDHWSTEEGGGELFWEVLTLLGMSNDFCREFVKSGRLEATYGTLVSTGKAMEVLKLFGGDCFITAYAEMGYPEIAGLVDLVVGYCPDVTEVQMTLVKEWVRFVTVLKTKDGSVLGKCVKLGAFDMVNGFLAKGNPECAVDVYEKLIIGDGGVVDVVALEQLRRFYSSEGPVVDAKVCVIKFLLEHAKELTVIVEKRSFDLRKWIVPETIENGVVFAMFTGFMVHCTRYNELASREAMRAIIDAISPPMKESLIYEDVFYWFANECGAKLSVFDVDLFLKRVLLDASDDDVFSYMNFLAFSQLLRVVFSEGRGSLATDEMMMRLMTIMEKSEDGSNAQSVMFKLFTVMLSPAVATFLVTRIESRKVRVLMNDIAADNPKFMIDAFTKYGLLSLFEQAMGQSVEIATSLVEIASIIVKATGNRFFDDWALRQPKESPLFAIDGSVLTPLVCPESNDRPFILPSMVINCTPVTSQSPFNHYLIGRYAIPVYRKVGKKVPDVYIENSANQFLSYNDFEYLVSERPRDFSKFLKRSELHHRSIECFGCGDPTWITVDGNFSSAVFFVAFFGVTDIVTPFLVFDSLVLSVHDGRLLYDNDKMIARVYSGRWHKFSVVMDSRKTLMVMIDGLAVFKASASKLLSIGAEKSPSVHFAISATAAFSDVKTPEDATALKVSIEDGRRLVSHGAAVSVPHNSYIDILSQTVISSRMVERLSAAESDAEFNCVFELILMSCSGVKKDQRRVIAELRRVLGEHNSKLCADHFQVIMATVTSFEDVRERHTFLCDFLFDFSFVSSLKSAVLTALLAVVVEYLEGPPEMFNADMLCDAGFLRFCATYMFLYCDASVCALFARMIAYVAGRAKMEKLSKLGNIVVVSGMFDKDVGIETISIKREEQMLKYDGTSQAQKHLLAAVLIVEGKRQTKILSDSQRIFLALLCDDSVLLKLVDTIIPLCTDSSFLNQNASPLVAIFRRCSSSKKMWTGLLRLLFKDKTFEFGAPSVKLALRSRVLAIILDVLTSSFNDMKNDVSECVFAAISEVIPSSYKCFKKKRLVGPMVRLLQGCMLKSTTPLDGNRALFVKMCEDKFIKTQVEMSRECASTTAKFMVDILLVSLADIRDFVFFLNIVRHANANVLLDVIVRLIASIMEINVSRAVLTPIGDLCLFLLIKHGSEIDVETLSTTIFAFCTFETSRVESFNLVWLLTMRHETADGFSRTCRLLQDHADKLSIKRATGCYPYFHLLLNRKVAGDNNFASAVWSQFTDCVSRLPVDMLPDRLRLLFDCGSFDGIRNSKNLSEFEELFASYFDKTMKRVCDTCSSFPDIITESERSLAEYLLPIASANAILCVKRMRRITKDLNVYVRFEEDVFAFALCNAGLNKSQHRASMSNEGTTPIYRCLPFHGLNVVPLVMIPDEPFDADLVKRTISLFGLETLDYFESPGKGLSSVSCRFRVGSLLSEFATIFGSQNELVCCTLIRRAFRIPCVLAIQKEMYFIVTGASLVNGDFELHDIDDDMFRQSVLSFEFGRFSLFCGHPVFRVVSSTVIGSYVKHGKLFVNSCGIGPFVLKFDYGVPSALKPQIVPTISVSGWQNNNVSTLELLVGLNTFSGRSFEDLSLYPIFPRIMSSFDSAKFSEDFEKRRDLAIPIPVLSDREPDHATLRVRMENSGYHHCENISNAAQVSTFMIRVIPFFDFQQRFHGGFDHVDRVFTSVSNRMSISTLSTCEFCPEMFCCPEAFMDTNKLTLKDGQMLSVELPVWSRNAVEFIEMHRYALESVETRVRLSHWIDLVFGVNQTGKGAIDAMNVYNPMSYRGCTISCEDKVMHEKWIESCGQLPEQLYSSPFPAYVGKEAFTISQIEWRLNPVDCETNVVLTPEKGVLRVGRLETFDERFFTASAVEISNNAEFLAVVFVDSGVSIFHATDIGTKKAALTTQMNLMRSGVEMNVFNERQMICATVCSLEVVIWSFVNGMITGIIDRHDVRCAVFDDEMNMLFCSVGSVVYQYSINGILVREIDVGVSVTSLAIIGLGFSFDRRVVMVGTMTGTVVMLTTDLETRDMKIVADKRLTGRPVMRITVAKNEGSQRVNVFSD